MTEYLKINNIYKRETYGKNRLIEGDYSSPELEYLADNDWVWTEKVDGTNIRVIWDGYRVELRGRTDKADIPKHLRARLEELFCGESKEEFFEEMFGKKEAVLYGEGFGEKIQKNGEMYGSADFILFDGIVNGYWLSLESTQDIAARLGIRHVPVVGRGTLTEAVDYIRRHPGSKLRDHELEGIVCRPGTSLYLRDGTPIRVKIKCRDF